jgi:hypothetical protein
MSDKKKKRDRPGRGWSKNAARTARAKRRVEKETALIGDLSRRENRDCVFRHRERLRAEILVYVLRQQLHVPATYDKNLYEACAEALLTPAAPGAKRPRAAVLVTALVRKAMRLSGLPKTEKDFRQFFAAATEMIHKGVYSTEPSDLFWQERFGLRVKDRLSNIVGLTHREIEGRNKALSYENVERVHPTVLLSYATPETELEAAEDDRMRNEAVAAVRRALARLPHPNLRLVYSVDNGGRLITNAAAARKLDCTSRTIQNLRERARDLLADDEELIRDLKKIGYRIKSEEK